VTLTFITTKTNINRKHTFVSKICFVSINMLVCRVINVQLLYSMFLLYLDNLGSQNGQKRDIFSLVMVWCPRRASFPHVHIGDCDNNCFMLNYLKSVLKQNSVSKVKVGAPSAKIDTNFSQTPQRSAANNKYT